VGNLLNKFGTERILTIERLWRVLGVPKKVLIHVSKNATDYYDPFVKTIGDKKRKIANPNKALKSIQKRIIKTILSGVVLPDEIVGARMGSDIKKNALIHRGQPVVVTVDLRDCFPSTSWKRIFRLFREGFVFSEEVSGILTNLTTYRWSLPQGGVTSAALLNILMIPLCEKIKKILPKACNLSMWVDDITFSGECAHLYCQAVIAELQKFGYRTRSRKIKVMFGNMPQIVTGLVTNSTISVPKGKIDRYLRDYRNNGCNEETTEGRVNHVYFINANQGRRLKRRMGDHLGH